MPVKTTLSKKGADTARPRTPFFRKGGESGFFHSGRDTTSVLQRKPIFESKAEPPQDDLGLQRKCAACEQGEKLQKKEDGGASQGASPGVERSLSASKGGGTPLPGQTRKQMEASFHADFGNVRIHDNRNAAAMSDDLHAQAFTHGRDIYFGAGKYDTSSKEGKHLLAHELTHTIQQGGVARRAVDGSDPFFQPKLKVGSPNDVYEKEADSMADKVVQRMSRTESPKPSGETPGVQAKLSNVIAGSEGGSIQEKCACEEDLQKKEEDAKSIKGKQKKSFTEPLEEVYIARKDQFWIAIPKTMTTVGSLVSFLFKTANPGEEAVDASADPESVFNQLIKGVKDLNGMTLDSIYPKQHVFLGDLPMKHGLRTAIFETIKKGPIFSPDVTDPEFELSRMGVSSVQEFIARKAVLHGALQLDITIIMGLIDDIADTSSPLVEKENAVFSMMQKWVREPLTQHPIMFPNGGEFFNDILRALRSRTTTLHHIFGSDEWTSYFDLMLNHFKVRKSDIQTYINAYSYEFKGEKATREMSLWDDFAKPALISIPGAITEETACFIESIPSDLAKNAAEHLHGISKDYLDAVLPENGETNQQVLDIACTFGGIVFDLAGSLAKVAKLIEKIHDAEQLYNTYKEVDGLLADLPGMLSIFDSFDSFLDVLFAVKDNASLDRLEAWVMEANEPAAGKAAGEKAKPNAEKSASNTGLGKIRKIVMDLVGLIRNILRPVFAIRKKFQEFIGRAEAMLIDHPVLIKVLYALKDGKRIAEMASGDIAGQLTGAFGGLFEGIKEGAKEFIGGLGDKVIGIVTGIKDQLIAAITEFAMTEIKGLGGTVKAALSIPAVKEKIKGLISSKLIGPFLDKIVLDKVMAKAKSVIDMLTAKASAAIDTVIDGFTGYLREAAGSHHSQLQRKDSVLGAPDIQRNVEGTRKKLAIKIIGGMFETPPEEAEGIKTQLVFPPHVQGPRKAMDSKLKEMVFSERKKLLGHAAYSFSRNIAVAKVIVNDDVRHPVHIIKLNIPDAQHSEQEIGAELKKMSDQEAKKKGTRPKIVVEQLFSEREPCVKYCKPLMNKDMVGFFKDSARYFVLEEVIGEDKLAYDKNSIRLMRAYGLNDKDIEQVKKNKL
jgi:Domain of unknown function (DUF4157)/Xanthomonas XOO_2897-like deaminase